ncbi:MAG: hypothetical protein HY924_07360 [Elusimicrobia bacterium]|nr:hypothetical protein [Elusimicrobiota bacterium]
MSPMVCRHAAAADKAALLKVCEKRDPCAKGRFSADLADPACSWVAGLEGSDIVGAACLKFEPETRLGKVLTLCAKGAENEAGPRLKALLKELLSQVRSSKAADIVYSTTRTLTAAEQAATVEAGFKPLGVFPGAPSLDGGPVSGLTAWFADGVLSKLRHAGFALHPAIAPFYALAAEACGLPRLAVAEPPRQAFPDAIPALELVAAPRFAAERFRRLRARRSLSVNFYPFSEPNVVVLSADEAVQVFASLQPELGFATILGERLAASVHPVKLYHAASSLLQAAGASYIEAINDAADLAGVECILGAGFRPCGYFPCLKLSAAKRRDFVVFALSEKAPSLSDAPEMHRPYLQAYLQARKEVRPG